MSEHWLIKAGERYYEAHKIACCATMQINIFSYGTIPNWIKEKCPWCGSNLNLLRNKLEKK